MEPGILDDILRRLDLLEARQAELERRVGVSGESRVSPLLRPSLGVQTLTPPPVQPVAQPTEVAERPVDVDAEYRIGAQILPKAGAALVIVGLAYLVSMAVGRGLITPAMLWWGVDALCLLFIGFGQWKREEREDFGHILTGVGACGLYLNFAAGHLFQHLYSGETLVVLFISLSVLNLAYALWRSSRSFLALGLIGGLIAALMPLDRNDYGMNALLHFVIVVPAAWIVARHRWQDMSWWLYGVSAAALVPIAMAREASDTMRVAAVLANGLITVAACAQAFRHDPKSFDPHGIFPSAALAASGLIAYFCLRNPMGALWMVAYGVSIATMATLAARDKELRLRLFATAAAIPAIIAPYGFRLLPEHSPLSLTPWLFLAIALILAAASLTRFFSSRHAAGLAGIELTLGLAYYIYRLTINPLPWQLETAFLISGLTSLGLIGWAMARASGKVEASVLTASAIAVVILARIGNVAVPATTDADVVFGTMTGLLAGCMGLIALTRLTSWRFSPGLLWVGMAAAFWSLFLVLLGARATAGTEIVILLLFGAVLAGSMQATAKAGDSGNTEALALAGSALGGMLLSRLGYTLLNLPAVGVHTGMALAMPMLLVVVLSAIAGNRYRLSAPLVTSVLFGLSAGWAYAQGIDGGLPWAQDVLIASAMLGTLIVLAAACMRIAESRDPIIYGASLVGWLLASRLGFLLLTSVGVGMAPNAAITFSWIVVAVVLLTAGFMGRARQLRYVGLAVIASTVGKVLLVDLAALDPGIRVAILLVLGLAMIGGGYVYIRSQKPALG